MQPKYNVAATLEKNVAATLEKNVGKTFIYTIGTTKLQRSNSTLIQRCSNVGYCDNQTATFECNLNTTLQQRLEKNVAATLEKKRR
ncbi:hypothetical protein DPMN_113182 [Dreissena polymorpha]|uniref:Uncharacterized protein n=1 Tax=Dreissena polymorpha TaxID=45954 RepID=A0A9D4KHU4_DREPO|nr:hypothetical protein DPMN_113182 [Dreissena polymorpha]